MDSVTLTVINNYLVNTCREMGTTMMKTSYSSIEGLNFSMVAYGEFRPAQLGAEMYTMRWTIAEVGVESFEPGDVVIHNDPYRGGCHMPEHTVIKPIYCGSELYGFAGNIGHVIEIGGKAVGGFAVDAKEVYQEGLRLPPIKIMRSGEYVEDIWRIDESETRRLRRTPKDS